MSYNFTDTIEPGQDKHAMSIQTFFNGINLDAELTDDEGEFTTLTVSGRRNTENKIPTLGVPGMQGVHEEQGAMLRPRNPVVKFRLWDTTNEGFAQRLTKLNSLLKGAKRELSFPDEDVIYYATLEELDIPEEESNDLIGKITFLCSDPFKYGPEISYPLTDESNVENTGTAEADPIFHFEVEESITFLAVENQSDNYNMIGRPTPIDVTPQQREELILDDNMSGLGAWQVSDRVDNGTVAGEMISKDGKFEAKTWGVAVRPFEWQGPSVTRKIGAQLLDFRMQVEVELLNVGKGTGMIEFYLLDINGNTVMKIGIEDIWRDVADVQGKFQLDPMTDNVKQNYVKADHKNAWNNFKGVLQLFRFDGKVRPYFALVEPDGTHNYVSSAYTVMDDNQTPISQIQTAIRIFGGTKSAKMRIGRIRFWRYNYGVPLEHENLIFHDKMYSTDGWEKADEVDDGTISGTIVSDEGKFVVGSSGTAGDSASQFYGPSIKRPIGEPLGDFRLQALIEMHNKTNKTGALEIYMLDKDDNIVMKIGLEDVYKKADRIKGDFLINHSEDWSARHVTQAADFSGWNNFKGMIQLFRSRGRVRPYFALIMPDGTHNYVSSDTYIMDQAHTPVTQVQIAFRQKPNSEGAYMEINDMRVWRYASEQEIIDDQADYIANKGDTITLDHKKKQILINGQTRDELKDFGGNYFGLTEGKNEIEIRPPDSVTASVKFRKRFI